jgi:type IV secretion system protein TrbL
MNHSFPNSLRYFFAVLFFLLCTQFSSAQEANIIVDRIEDNALGWASNLVPEIRRLFILLATLDFVWLGVRLTLKSSPLEEWTSQIVRKILFYGIGLYFLFNGFTIANAITSSFIELATTASGSGTTLSATSIWERGLDTAKTLFENNSFWDGFKMQLVGGLTAILILLLAAYITATILLAYAEAYIVMGAGTVVLGLLGSDWTKEYGRKYFTFALVTGLKLFITLLLGQLGLNLIDGWLGAIKGGDIGQIFGGLASFVIFALLITRIPNTIASMMAGGGIQGSESVAASALRAAAAAGAVAATGGASAVGNAVALTKAEGAKGIGQIAGGTVKNLAKSFAEDLGRAGSDRYKKGVSGSGHRMSASMKQKSESLKAKAERESENQAMNTIAEGGEEQQETSQNHVQKLQARIEKRKAEQNQDTEQPEEQS